MNIKLNDHPFFTSSIFWRGIWEKVTCQLVFFNELGIANMFLPNYVMAYHMLSLRGIWEQPVGFLFSELRIEDYFGFWTLCFQILLKWGLEQGVSVLPKSYNKDRIAENYQIFDWSLTKNDYEKISEIKQKKIITREGLVNSTTSPYRTVEELWDGEMW